MTFLVDALDIPELRVRVNKSTPLVFYAKVEKDTGKLLGISKTIVENDSTICVQIDESLAREFTSGKKRLRDFFALKLPKGGYQIENRARFNQQKVERLSNLALQQVVNIETEELDISIQFVNNETCLIYYDADELRSWDTPVKLFMVDSDNPSLLKGIIALSANTLDDISKAQKLKQWPNPIVVNIQDALSTDVFITHNDIKVTIQK